MNLTNNAYKSQVVLWVGIFFMAIRIRLSVLMPIRIRILPLTLPMLANQKNLGILFTAMPVYIVYLSHRRHRHPSMHYL
jgi:hypothetical protein